MSIYATGASRTIFSGGRHTPRSTSYLQGIVAAGRSDPPRRGSYMAVARCRRGAVRLWEIRTHDGLHFGPFRGRAARPDGERSDHVGRRRPGVVSLHLRVLAAPDRHGLLGITRSVGGIRHGELFRQSGMLFLGNGNDIGNDNGGRGDRGCLWMLPVRSFRKNGDLVHDVARFLDAYEPSWGAGSYAS